MAARVVVRRSLFLLFIIIGTGCTPPPRTIDIPVEVWYDGQPITCDSADLPVRLTDVRFYIHNIQLGGADGQRLPLVLLADGIWQNDSVVLIDLENGEGSCLNGSPDMNSRIRGVFTGDASKGLTFEIGVPVELNHADPMQAGAPLSYTAMHWHWASGYKFIRAGVQTENDGFFLHLGSSRCEGTIGNIKGCQSANRPSIQLADFIPGQSRLVLDLGELFGGVNFTDGMRTDCMSGPTNEHCRNPFASLGIDFDTGERMGRAAVFKSRPAE